MSVMDCICFFAPKTCTSDLSLPQHTSIVALIHFRLKNFYLPIVMLICHFFFFPNIGAASWVLRYEEDDSASYPEQNHI